MCHYALATAGTVTPGNLEPAQRSCSAAARRVSGNPLKRMAVSARWFLVLKKEFTFLEDFLKPLRTEVFLVSHARNLDRCNPTTFLAVLSLSIHLKYYWNDGDIWSNDFLILLSS